MALLTAHKLMKTFGDVRAVDGASFQVDEGRCVALLGPNGAGKTTTIQMITGLLRPTSGEIRMNGVAPGQDYRGLIGYLPQAPAFYGWMSGREYLIHTGRLCGMSAKEAERRSSELLERVGIGSAGKRRIAGYSGGMKQRLGLAQALIHRPKLLVLDEPVSALDPIGRREVMALLGELKAETTVLFSTHVLHDAEELCDDVLIMRSGRIALGGSLESIRERDRKPVLTLETEGDADSRKWLESWLQRLPDGVEAASRTASSVRLVARDLNSARSAVLRELAEARVRVAKLEIGQTTLEDLFMRAVGNP